MNTDVAQAAELADDIANGCAQLAERLDIAIFPPFPYLHSAAHAVGHRPVLVGGQDVSAHAAGAYTGQTSAAMLVDLGCRCVLIGHSERRHGLGELDALLRVKLARAVENGLIPVLCVGETKAQRREGRACAVIDEQVRSSLSGISEERASGLVVAYEPVWAIGTGLAATADDAQQVHCDIVRKSLADQFGSDVAQKIRILYGGSVNAANAAEYFTKPDIDGALVGGASLKSDDFIAIVQAASN